MSHAGNIQQRRAEILRLIAKVKGSTQPRSRSLRSVPDRAPPTNLHGASPPSRAKPSRRDHAPVPAEPALRNEIGAATSRAAENTAAEVAKLVDRQDRLERALQDTATTAALEGLQERLDRIEALIAAERNRPETAPSAPDPEADCTFAGKLDLGLLSDMLQLVSTNQLTGVFVVEDGGFSVELYFDEGDICHAIGPDMEGEAAFFAVMSLEQGRYRFYETTELPPERTVHSKTQFLILEGLRRIDEERAGLQPETG